MEPSKVLLLATLEDPFTTALLEILRSASNPRATKLQLESVKLDFLFPDLKICQIVSDSCPQLILLVLPPFANTLSEVLVREIKATTPTASLMVAIENCQPEKMLRLLESGVADFLAVPFKAVDVLPRIWRVLDQTPNSKSLARELKAKLGLKHLIGASPVFLAEVKKIPLIAKCDANILITGETGTGKELCARAIHYLSPRASHALIPVNCGATPVELLENELFGHERGAFTGATRSQPGLVQEAHGGTLFLDEIDCLPLLAQVKLLRFIQEREYRPLGSTKIHKADVRIISASNVIIEESVNEGKFRQDLFFRLNIIPLRLPPLRERQEDIPLLAEHFLIKYAREYKKNIKYFSPEAMRNLKLYDWPGNARELEYIIQRAVALAEQPVIDEIDIPTSGLGAISGQDSFREAKAKVVRNFERTYIHHLLLANDGNITKAALIARKNRRAFWQLIRKHGIDAREFKLKASSTWPDN
jgi:DNA-binding NtrC family response regulator